MGKSRARALGVRKGNLERKLERRRLRHEAKRFAAGAEPGLKVSVRTVVLGAASGPNEISVADVAEMFGRADWVGFDDDLDALELALSDPEGSA